MVTEVMYATGIIVENVILYITHSCMCYITLPEPELMVLLFFPPDISGVHGTEGVKFRCNVHH